MGGKERILKPEKPVVSSGPKTRWGGSHQRGGIKNHKKKTRRKKRAQGFRIPRKGSVG